MYPERNSHTLCTSLSRLKTLLGSHLLSSQKSPSSAFCFFSWNHREQTQEGRSACVNLAPPQRFTAPGLPGGSRALFPRSAHSLSLSLYLLLLSLSLSFSHITLSTTGQCSMVEGSIQERWFKSST